MRIAVGGIAQESQSFSPVPGSWDHFSDAELFRGQEMLTHYGKTRTEIGAIVDVVAQRAAHAAGAPDRSEPVTLVPLIYAKASASAGHVEQAVFEGLRDELLTRLNQAGPVDGILLVLHGSMVADGYDDATGEILRAVRAQVGPTIPVVGTLDLHANVTVQMTAHATALVGYHTAPHVDMYETAQRGMAILLATVAGTVQPATALEQLPMLLPGETARTDAGPLAQVMELAYARLEEADILDISVFSVQPWLDVLEVGSSVVVVADGDAARAAAVARELAAAFWPRRHEFGVDLTPTAQAVTHALAAQHKPVILADSADAPSSGAPGDSTVLLQVLLDAPPHKPCYLNIADAAAAQQMAAAGVGNDVTVTLGNAAGSDFYPAVTVTGRVRMLADGAFVQKGPGFQGDVLHRGLCGVLQIGQITLVVMSRACRQWDPELYRSLGLEPADAQLVQVKSPAAFRAAYGPFAAEILIIDAPGVCSPNLAALPFKRVRRPLFPLDPDATWPG